MMTAALGWHLADRVVGQDHRAPRFREPGPPGLSNGRIIDSPIPEGMGHPANAKVSKDVWFAHLRDGTASHSGDNVTLTKMVMGHSLSGEIDRYKIRDSIKVKPACLELERYYFGDHVRNHR